MLPNSDVNCLSLNLVGIQVERRCHEQLSCEEFFTKYACGHIPVIITGLVSHMTSAPWTLDHIKKVTLFIWAFEFICICAMTPQQKGIVP